MHEWRLLEQKQLLNQHLRKYASDRVVDAMMSVPRELFVDKKFQRRAYVDEVAKLEGYPISSVSQPNTVALMTNLLDPQPQETVLEIGTASGYQAAVISRLAKKVVTVEIEEELVLLAHRRLKTLGITNVDIVNDDGGYALAEGIFDKVIVTASIVPHVAYWPGFANLREGGIFVAPLGGVKGDPGSCEIIKANKKDGLPVIHSAYPGYTFFPTSGNMGWDGLLIDFIKSIRQHFFDKSDSE